MVLKRYNSREAKISVTLLDLKVIKITTLVKSDLSEITIQPIFCGCLREKNTHLKRLDDTTDKYDILRKETNSSNCILINLATLQKSYNMAFL